MRTVAISLLKISLGELEGSKAIRRLAVSEEGRDRAVLVIRAASSIQDVAEAGRRR